LIGARKLNSRNHEHRQAIIVQSVIEPAASTKLSAMIVKDRGIQQLNTDQPRDTIIRIHPATLVMPFTAEAACEPLRR
jgi:hypothetical protein